MVKPAHHELPKESAASLIRRGAKDFKTRLLSDGPDADAQLMREIPGAALTLARLPLGWDLAHAVAERYTADDVIRPSMQTLVGKAGVMVAADVADGAALRMMKGLFSGDEGMYGADTPLRRTADGVVDQAQQLAVAVEIYRHDPDSRTAIKIIAGRALAVGAINMAHLVKTGEVTKGGWAQKIANLTHLGYTLYLLGTSKYAGGNNDEELQADENSDNDNELVDRKIRRSRNAKWVGAATVGISMLTALRVFKGLGRQHPNGGGIRQL